MWFRALFELYVVWCASYIEPVVGYSSASYCCTPCVTIVLVFCHMCGFACERFTSAFDVYFSFAHTFTHSNDTLIECRILLLCMRLSSFISNGPTLTVCLRFGFSSGLACSISVRNEMTSNGPDKDRQCYCANVAISFSRSVVSCHILTFRKPYDSACSAHTQTNAVTYYPRPPTTMSYIHTKYTRMSCWFGEHAFVYEIEYSHAYEYQTQNRTDFFFSLHLCIHILLWDCGYSRNIFSVW